MTITRVGAIILGAGPDRLATELGYAAKGLILVNDVPLGQHVMLATRGSNLIATTTYVGPANWELLPHEYNVPGGDRLVDSLQAGIDSVTGFTPPVDWVLIITADLPHLTTEDIDVFLRECEPAVKDGAQLCYGVVPERVMESAYPGEKRTYVTLADGRVTGGNVALVHKSLLPTLLGFIDRLFKHRKNPIALATLFGIRMIFALVFKRARIAAIEERAGTLIGAKLRAVLTSRAAIANDVDTKEHLHR